MRSLGFHNQKAPSFSTSAQLVLVDTQVTEKNTGKVIDTLRKSDFEIYDNGVKREIKEYSFEMTSLDIAFVLHSGRGWASARVLNAYQAAMNEAVAEMESRDRGAVIGHHAEFSIDVPMSGNKAAIQHELRVVRRRKIPASRFSPRETHLFDALETAITVFPKPRDRARRRVMLALRTAWKMIPKSRAQL